MKYVVYNLQKFSSSGKSGQAALIAVILMLFIMLSLIFGISALSLRLSRIAREDLRSRHAFFIAEAGVDDAVYRLKRGKIVTSSFTLSINGAVATTTVTTPFPTQKEVSSVGNFSMAIRSAKSLLSNLDGISFVYGVQVGDGGLVMENDSQVNGSVYSNGNITGKNSSLITGDAFAASTSVIKDIDINGSARAHSIIEVTTGLNASSTNNINSVTVGKNAYANHIINSSISTDAYYQTSISGSSVGGVTFPGTPAPLDLPKLDMPIPDSKLDAWEQDALSGGVISSPCPYQPANGSSLGPVKINCDLIIDGTKIITLTGTLWVAGNFDIKNSAKLQLAPSFGSLSGIVIVDNPSNRLTSSKITVQNSSQILGSGDPASFVIITSRNNSAENGGDEEAIEVKNSSNAPIYYAPHGEVSLENNVSLKEVTAYKIEIENSAAVTYDSGLANVNFSSGPTGGWNIDIWREVQ